MTGKNIRNMGVPSETAMSIAARMGAYDIVASEDVIIPSRKPVSFGITSTNGDITPCNTRLGGWNPCTLGGISGRISADVDWESSPRKLNFVTFTRDEEGEKTIIPKGTRLMTASQKTSADWNVIFVGTNGGWSKDNLTSSEHLNNGDEAKFVSLIEDMVNHAPYQEKCVIIGITAGADRWTTANSMLAEKFGDRFIDAKPYFSSEQSLADAGITPTSEDIKAIAEKKVPPSLLDDTLHFNDAGYKLMAKLVYNKLIELGFENEQ